MNKLKKAAIMLPLMLMFLLACIGVENETIFVDESQSLCIGQNVAEYGLPVAWNGEFLVTYVNGNDYNQDLIHMKYPWLQYYLMGIIFFFAGNNIIIYKISFIIIGVITAYCLYKLAFSLTQNENMAQFALWMYSLSITVIALIRCIRYYAPSLLVIILTLYTYNEFVRTKSKRYLGFFLISSVLLFHCFHVFFICVMMAILILYLFFDRKKVPLKYAVISTLCIVVACLPPALYYLYFSFVISNENNVILIGSSIYEKLLINLSLYNSYVAPFFY